MFEIIEIIAASIVTCIIGCFSAYLTYKYKMEKLKLEREKFEFEKKWKEEREGNVVVGQVPSTY
jgi:hypothetical protein